MRRRRIEAGLALAAGLVTHALFLAAVGAMAWSLHEGMRPGLGTLRGAPAWIANAALALQFPLLHSILLTRRGRNALARAVPCGIGRDLAPTTFAGVAALQILATFALWSPVGPTLEDPRGPVLWICRGAFAGSWLLLGKAMADAGLGLQTGYAGWTAVLRGRRFDLGPMPARGLFRTCRQPVYLAFALVLWTAPVRTLDGLMLAAVWTGYCLLGPLHKERRYLARYGEEFAGYRARVPYFLPRLPA
ncbi:MAG: isoprenylcysteine carboxylmethyltransferase family protein [Planctomycetes bacterium]|nr:isoprenylcysteine carboxylmethyltransferase family protein [Planctomycetota bacterium]